MKSLLGQFVILEESGPLEGLMMAVNVMSGYCVAAVKRGFQALLRG